ncbi:MFS transporter [Frondihabitans australicus]|uniref:Putative MFS family arabinose efflux permease n=1 Tax=Frondihabitans australicus TaxID=386892 RepID=A0A495III2_9MICO|nr:MFS transporter [Frondihabitans australicus]RKR75852.1 putative MFS family arabinose efflux permease [Frondihabitans australicus]
MTQALSSTAATRRHPLFFVVVAILVALFPAASSAPSPLYVIYQREWGFSSATLTVIFAIYAVGLLAALLTVGRLSDHIGRRPVLLAAIALEIISMIVFLAAGDTAALCVARLIQGVATGTAISAMGASLVDLAPQDRKGRAGLINSIAPSVGLALGALGCGALAEYAPAPTRLVYAVTLACLIVAAVAIARMPDTVARRAGAVPSLVPRVGIQAEMRRRLTPIIPALLAAWALGGLYFSLGPSIAQTVFGYRNHLAGAVVITIFCGIAAFTSLALARVPLERLGAPAAIVVGAGGVAAFLGVRTDTTGFAVIGTLLAGIGFGAISVASFGTVARWARAEHRGAVIAAVYILCYFAFSAPAVAAGFAATRLGLVATTEGYLLVVIAAAIAALALTALFAPPSHTPPSAPAEVRADPARDS